MLFFPKPTSRKKSPKPSKRTRKHIAKRSVFKAYGANPLKSYRRRYTDAQVRARAYTYRQQRLHNRTAAEIRLSEILDCERILYESEAIFLNGDRFILADFYFKAHRIVIEIDGSAHGGQKGYDRGRDAWLLRVYGIRTVRFTNADIFKESQEVFSRLSTYLGVAAPG